MSYIHSIATYSPSHTVNQQEVKAFAKEIFSNSRFNLNRLLTVFDNTQIDRRTVLKELEWYGKSRSFKERNEEFCELGLELSTTVCQKVIQQAGLTPQDIDVLIVITSSGFVTPTLDARIIDELGFRDDIIRMPITGMGCAGGVYGLSRAREFSEFYPEKTILLVSVETCTLTFRPKDKRKANLVALSLFGDGAAAAIISSQKISSGIKLLGNLSQKWKNSLNIMGWNIHNDGLQVVFDKSIPDLIHKNFREVYDKFLKKFNKKEEDIKHFLFHPGGAKVIQAFEDVLNKKSDEFYYTSKILREYGNMSSPTVLYVIKEFLDQKQYGGSESGAISAMGPGFSCELVLFETVK